MAQWMPIAVGLTVLAAAQLAPRQEADPLAGALSQPILTPGQAQEELERFCESRVPRMPSLTSKEEWRKYADRNRKQTLEKVVFRGEAARWRDAQTRVEWLETIEGGPGYHIRKLRLEALPGLWIPALLYQPDKLTGKVPVILNVNGHDAEGKAAAYKQVRCINLAKRGMLALNLEWFGMGQLRTQGFQHGLINGLDLTGTSGIAPHYLAMKRALDVLLRLEHADSTRVAVTGLSGGGWQTIFISGLDPRVTLSNPVAGYSSFRTRIRNHTDLGDSEQTPCDLATVTDYAQLTALRAPNPTLLTFNAKDDCCFRADHALQPLLDAAGPVYKLFGKEGNLRSHINEDPGTHNYLRDNREAFYRMVGDHFYPGKPFDPTEIPSDAEVKTREQLEVALPEQNADFGTLAAALAKNLPKDGTLPQQLPAAQVWQKGHRLRLREVVHAHDYPVQASQVDTQSLGEVTLTRWKLRLGDTWTVPVVELAPRGAKETVLLAPDGGRKDATQYIQGYLTTGRRVCVMDSLLHGEEAPQPQRDAYLWALMLGTVGERPVGLQASQIRAAAQWLNGERKLGPVTLAASGPRSTLAALVAGGMDENTFGAVELIAPLGSLKDPLEQKILYQQAPELFCFGLLESFDVRQLAALCAPRPVRLFRASPAARQGFGDLSGWYRLFPPVKQ